LKIDVCNIEAGLILTSGYSTTALPFTLNLVNSSVYDGFRGITAKRGSSGRSPDQERKRGVPWTEEKHKYEAYYLYSIIAYYFSF
jgi:hypothetical protein